MQTRSKNNSPDTLEVHQFKSNFFIGNNNTFKLFNPKSYSKRDIINIDNQFATTHSHINYAVSHSAGDRIGCDDGTCEFGDIPRNKWEDRI